MPPDRAARLYQPYLNSDRGCSGITSFIMVSDLDKTDASHWLLLQIVIAGVAITCYGNSLLNDYCDDGVPIVVNNELVHEPGRWLDCWTTDHWYMSRNITPNRDLLYRPAALTSYRIIRSIFGPTALPQLALNIFLHALISVGLSHLARRLGVSVWLAAAAGLLFAVLPVHTEVINNVVGRADLLATLGVLCCLLAHQRVIHSHTRTDVVSWSALAAVACFVAMSAKESGVSVVAMLPVCHIYFCSTMPNRPPHRWLHPWRLVYVVIPVVVYFTLRYYALDGHLFQKPAPTKTINFLVDAPAWQKVLGALQLWGMYWEKTLWPKTLCAYYSINELKLATSIFVPSVMWGLLTLASLVVCSILAWRRGCRMVILITVCLMASYLPAANLLVLIQISFAERIWYLPSLWVCLLLVMAIGPLLRSRTGVVIGCMVLCAMLSRSWIRNSEWKNNLTLYTAAYRVHPDGVVDLRKCGQAMVNAGQVAEGIPLLQRAIEIDLGFTDAQRSLGLAFAMIGQYPAALHHLQIANMQVPGHPKTIRDLNEVSRLVLESHPQELAMLKLRADENPENLDAELMLIHKLRELNQLEQLIERFKLKETAFARHAQWQHEYAVTHVYLDQRDQAIDRYRQAISLDESNVQRMIELAMLLLERRAQDDLEQAWLLTVKAKAIEPHAPNMLICQAELLALKGEFVQAYRLYNEAIRAIPKGTTLRRIYEQRAKALGMKVTP